MNRCRCCGKGIGYDRKICFSCFCEMVREWVYDIVL